MPEEVLIPKMKRLDKKRKSVKLTVNNFMLGILCPLLLIGATFIDINIKHYIIPAGFNFSKHFAPDDFIYSFSIIPQIPVLMLICSALGRRLATTCACLYVAVGLFILPVFALGGGITYIAEYSFGYIIAFILGVFIAGTFLNKKYSFLNMILAAILGVAAIHICGIVYMILLALINGKGSVFIHSWINAQSGLKILYDIVLGFVGILIGKYIHEFLRFISD